MSKSNVKCRRLKPPTRLLVSLTLLFGVFLICLTSCNVTRKVTTQSEYTKHGDTSVVIVTKTIESYDATKKFYQQ